MDDKTVAKTTQGDAPSRSQTEPADASSPVPAVAIDKYMDALANGDVSTYRSISRRIGGASPAAVYLQHVANVTEADMDGGTATDYTGSVERVGDSYQLCYEEDPGNCVEYANLETNAGGELVDFTVNGKKVSDLVSRGNGHSIMRNGARFTFLTAYQSQQSNAVFVTLKVKTGANKIGVNSYSATYRTPSGKQRTSAQGGGPTDIAAHSNALIYAAFEDVPPGGVMTLDGCIADCMRTYKVAIKTR